MQTVLYTILWLTNEYVATLLTAVMVPIFIGITFISWLSDRVEASRVGKKYYITMILSAVIPLLVAGFFVWMYGGVMDIF